MRLWDLNIHHQCLIRIGGINYPMDMKVGFEHSSSVSSDRVTIKGDFNYLMTKHTLHPNAWLEFTLVQDPPTHGLMGCYKVIFDLKEL